MCDKLIIISTACSRFLLIFTKNFLILLLELGHYYALLKLGYSKMKYAVMHAHVYAHIIFNASRSRRMVALCIGIANGNNLQ